MTEVVKAEVKKVEQVTKGVARGAARGAMRRNKRDAEKGTVQVNKSR